MSQVIIDFETLKYNLYEILGIENDASDSKIKKAFKNLILNFHPDKNNQTEEDIYYHIVTANQILSNTELRQKYDNFLKKENTHDDLKNNFNKVISNEPELPDQETAFSQFNSINKKLEAKHLGNYEDKTIKNFNELLKERESEVNIKFEDIKSANDFNNKFEDRVNTGYFNDQIISTNEKMGLLFSGDNYTNLDVAFDNLYVDGDNISTSKFTSLDSAFKIQKLEKVDDYNIKDAINKYKSETNSYSANHIKFSKEKFDSWY